jgi:hypothetical protein
MDVIINKHIDTLEELEAELEIIIEDAIKGIDIEALIKAPKDELQRIADEVKEIFLREYAPQAVELGIDFAKAIQDKIDKDKVIKIQDSDDPNLNKDES